MSITVKEALAIGGLKNGELLAGHSGLDNIITSVSVIEIPDAVDWYRGNELQITAFYSISNDVQAQLRLITNLARYKCAALVICHSDICLKKIDDRVLDLADQLSFPLIRVPNEIAYIDIITPIMDIILQRQNAKLQMALDIHNEMTRAILAGKGITDLLKTVSAMINKPVILFDNSNEFISTEKINLSSEQTEELRRYITKRIPELIDNKEKVFATIPALPNKTLIISPILMGDVCYGALIAVCDYTVHYERCNFDLIALEHAGTAISLISMREKSLQEVKERMQRDMLEDLLTWNFADEEYAMNRARGIGWELSGIRLVIVINIDFFKHKVKNKSTDILHDIKEKLCKQIRNIVLDENDHNILSSRSDSVVIMLDAGSDNCVEKAYKRARYMGRKIVGFCWEKFDIEVSAGVSNYIDNINKIGSAYEEARTALDIGRIVKGAQSCSFYLELGFYPVLKRLAADKDILHSALSCYGVLVRYDNENGTDLTDTLKCLVDCSENTAEAANRLHLHKNSVLYRKQKIIDLLGYNPFDRPYRITFEIARELEKLSHTSQ